LMATVNAQLKYGLKIGDVVYRNAVIREATSGDILDAMEESEKVVLLPGRDKDEPALVHSPTMVGIHTMRRQIINIDEYKGPLSLAEVKRLHPSDLDMLQKKAEELEAAGLSGLIDRGRVDGGQGAD
jgi:phage FluMu protein gp41